MSNKIIKQQNLKESQDTYSVKKSVAFTAVIIMLLCCLSFLLLGKTDTAVFLNWQVGIMSLPLSRALFQNCTCLVPFGKILSIIIPGFLIWATGCLLNIPFNRVMCLVSIFIYMAFNIIFAKKQHMTSDELQNDLKNCIKYEAIFFGVFLFWTYLIDTSTVADINAFPLQATSGVSIDIFPLYGLPEKILITIMVDSIMQHSLQSLLVERQEKQNMPTI